MICLLSVRATFVNGLVLTVPLVNDELHLHGRLVLERLLHLLNGVLVSQVPVHKVTRAALLHDVSPCAPRHLTETVIAVDDGVPDNSGIGQDEVAICKSKTKKKKKREGLKLAGPYCLTMSPTLTMIISIVWPYPFSNVTL